MSVGNQIRSARQIAGYTQDELAKSIGVSRNTVSRWEHDKNVPSVEDMKKLSSLFDVSTEIFEVSTSDDSEGYERLISSSIDELRLELVAERKLRKKYIFFFSIGIVFILLFFMAFCFIYFNLSEWRDPNASEEPVRVIEYIPAEKGG